VVSLFKHERLTGAILEFLEETEVVRRYEWDTIKVHTPRGFPMGGAGDTCVFFSSFGFFSFLFPGGLGAGERGASHDGIRHEDWIWISFVPHRPYRLGTSLLATICTYQPPRTALTFVHVLKEVNWST
jgi:hypothetical protein